jgi:hypothetical protein
MEQFHASSFNSLSSTSSLGSIAARLRSTIAAVAPSKTATFTLDISAPFYLIWQRVKTKMFQALLVCVLAASAIAQSVAICTATESAKHVGEIATVTDRVDGVHQSSKGNIFLNMGGKYPNEAFTAWIPAASAGQFSNPQQYEGKTVAVSGKITLYHGKPEIVVTNVSQIIIK